jgi:hypothetical protein
MLTYHSSSALIGRILLRNLARRSASPAVAVRPMSMYNPIKFDEIDPDKIFDEIDTKGDGKITRDEFKAALGRLRYSDLMKIHDAAVANMAALDQKLKTLDDIEQDMSDLKNITEKKQQMYNNIGMTTAADLEELFSEAKTKRKRVKENVGKLRGLVDQTKDQFKV